MQRVGESTEGLARSRELRQAWAQGSPKKPGRKKGPLVVLLLLCVSAVGIYLLDEWRASSGFGLPALKKSDAPNQEFSSVDQLERPLLRRLTDRVRSGESLSRALERHDMSAQEVFHLAAALRKEFNLRSIQPGDVFILEKQIRAGGEFVDAFEIVRSDGFGVPIRYRLTRTDWSEDQQAYSKDPSYLVFRIDPNVIKKRVGLQGPIESSLYESVLQVGGDPALVNRFAEVFGWQIDFYREAQKGDHFKMIVESRYVDGRFVGHGRVLAAQYDNMGKSYRGYYFESADAKVAGIFDEKGNSMERSFLISPMELARITSRYGQRFHPILKRQKKHNGVDYGAPVGTPFWAVADGVVLEAHYSPTAGNMVKVRHKGGYVTEYFHASRIAPGIRAGVKIRQRQVLGYVGTTGRSTGPHLHYGMQLNEHYVDPARQKFQGGKAIPPAYAEAFKAQIKPFLQELEQLKTS